MYIAILYVQCIDERHIKTRQAIIEKIKCEFNIVFENHANDRELELDHPLEWRLINTEQQKEKFIQ